MSNYRLYTPALGPGLVRAAALLLCASPVLLAGDSPPAAQQRKPIMAEKTLRLPRLIEAEAFVGSAQVSAGPVSAQAMDGFGPDWPGDAQLFWHAPDPVDTPIRNWPHLTLYLDVTTAGSYALAVRYTQAPDYGDVRVFVGGKALADLSGYAAGVRAARAELGDVKLAAGKNQVVFTVFRRPQASQGSYVGLDAFELVRK